MAGIDRAAARVVALIALLMVAAASLRGYIPAAAHVPRQRTAGGPAMLAVVAVLLGASLAIVAVAIIGRMRDRRAVASSIRALPARRSGDKAWPGWRVLLIGLAVLLAWLLITWSLAHLAGEYLLDRHAPAPAIHAGAPPAGTATPPTPTAPAPTGTEPQPEEPPQAPGGDMFGYLTAAAAGMLMLMLVGAAVTARGRRAGAGPDGGADDHFEGTIPAPAPEPLVRAAELGLAEIGDLGREPRQAIIGCYVAMERELAHVPDAVPQDFDTPTEVLSRAVEHHALPADNAAQLVSLFAEARFSSHRMTEDHRAEAVRILRLVLDELRSRS